MLERSPELAGRVMVGLRPVMRNLRAFDIWIITFRWENLRKRPALRNRQALQRQVQILEWLLQIRRAFRALTRIVLLFFKELGTNMNHEME